MALLTAGETTATDRELPIGSGPSQRREIRCAACVWTDPCCAGETTRTVNCPCAPAPGLLPSLAAWTSIVPSVPWGHRPAGASTSKASYPHRRTNSLWTSLPVPSTPAACGRMAPRIAGAPDPVGRTPLGAMSTRRLGNDSSTSPGDGATCAGFTLTTRLRAGVGAAAVSWKFLDG